MISSLDVKNKENEVRLLGLELQELELNDRITELKAEPTIDEECVGCCKVVDVAAKLQEELDSAHNMYRASSDECCKQRKTIGDLRTELYYLKNSFPDNFWAVVTEKDSMIRRQGKVIEDFKTIETRETDRLHKIIDEMQNDVNIFEENDSGLRKTIRDYRETIQLERIDRTAEKEAINRKYSEDLRKKNTLIEELKDKNIEDLHELYDIDKTEFEDMKTGCEIMFRNYLNTIAKLQDDIKGLEAELSARKEDSAVLMKVVEIIRDESVGDEEAAFQIADVVEDYSGAPEKPPETPIDEPQEITVTFAWLELP